MKHPFCSFSVMLHIVNDASDFVSLAQWLVQIEESANQRKIAAVACTCQRSSQMLIYRCRFFDLTRSASVCVLPTEACSDYSGLYQHASSDSRCALSVSAESYRRRHIANASSFVACICDVAQATRI